MSKVAGAMSTRKMNGTIPTFGVKDTDFLLKLIMRSTFEGVELEVAHAVLTKLAEIHRVNLEG